MTTSAPERLGPLRSAVAWLGAVFIFALIRLLGRRVEEREVPWLEGPRGSGYIGDRPYEEFAAREGLTLERHAETGGLIPDMGVLESDSFRLDDLHPEVRRFYEKTANYRMDVWAKTYFPASIGLWLLVTTISRKVNQLNFPLDLLETAKGMTSEIVRLATSQGETRYSGWYRELVEGGRTLYSGFYTTQKLPVSDRRCVKVSFPMPHGNATVLLEPSTTTEGSMELRSEGRRFGEPGFYRLHDTGSGRLRVWRVASLKEMFRVYVDPEDVLRCDHSVRFLGLRVLHLHYRIQQAAG